MPLKWKQGENPYRNNYFSILELGPNAPPQMIAHKRADLVRKIQAGHQHVVAGRSVTEAEISEAEARLQDASQWAADVLLVHPVPGGESKRLQQICRAILEQATPMASRKLRLANLQALVPLLPTPGPEDIAWPDWEELQVPCPGSKEDRQCDVQFDL